MKCLSGKYRPTTGRRWWFGTSRVGGRTAGLCIGLAGRGYWFAFAPGMETR